LRKGKTLLLFVLLALVGGSLLAQEPVEAAAAPTGVRWGVVSAAFVLGIAAAAGAIGQGRAIAAAVEGTARNPSAGPMIRITMIIGLALIESLVIYALVIAFVIRGT
jgi:F-type H+-transporting ATPase subunit c